MKFYLQAFLKSLYDIEWLRGQKKNGKQSATYVVLLILVLSVVFSVFVIFQLGHLGDQFKSEILAEVPEFELQVEDAILSVEGIEQPYIFDIEDDSDNPFVLYVDTVTTSSLTVDNLGLEEETNIMLVTRDKMTIYDMETGSTQINDYREIPNRVLNKAEIQSWFESILSKKVTIFFFVLIATFVVLGIGKMVYLLILTLIAHIVQQIAKKGYTFGELFTIGLFAITAPSIVVMILRFLGYGVPYLYTILVLGYLLMAVFYSRESESSKKHDDIAS